MSMEDRDGVIWHDGQLKPWRDATLHVLAYTVQCGVGVFEGIRAYETPAGPAIFRAREHVERLFQSAHILQMPMPFSKAEIDAAMADVIRANGLARGYLRVLAYYDGRSVGVSAVGNQVHVAIAAWPWDAYLGADAHERGVRLKTASFNRQHINAAMAKAKATGHYINSMLALNEARQCGFDDALMLDTHGFVAECSTSNIFLVRKGRLATPEKVAVLEGVTRDTIMALAEDEGLIVEERNITRDELYCADEVFITGTAAEVTPVVDVDGRAIADGARGPVTSALQAAFMASVSGRDPARAGWLRLVDST